MPKLNDHGLGGGGKSLGVPVYPLESKNCYKLDDNGTWDRLYGDETVRASLAHSNANITGANIYNEMYFIGDNGAYNRCDKYNVHSKTWTTLANTPNESTYSNPWALSIGTDIWYAVDSFGAENDWICKYDTLTNTHHRIVQMPYRPYRGRACTDGTDIYIFGGAHGTTTAYKFEVSTSTFTQLANIPADMSQQVCEYDEGFVYLFGGSNNPKIAYKYDIANDSYTALASRAYPSSDSAHVKVDKYIFIISSSSSSYQLNMCVYDIVNNKYVELPVLLKARYYGNACEVDGIIYVIGGGNSSYTDDRNTYHSGDTMMVNKFVDIILHHQKLAKGVKVHTDGDVTDDCMLFGEHIVVKSDTTLEKTKGAILTSHDGEYAIMNANYVTIGG